MISRSLIEMIKGRWREFRREPSAFFFVLAMPVMWMIILGFAFSGTKPEKYSVGLVKQAQVSEFDSELRAILAERHWLKVQVGAYEDLEKKLKREEISLIISSQSAEKKLNYIFDPSHPEATKTRRFVNDLIQSSMGRRDILSTSDQALEVRGSRYIDFLIPGLLALSLFTTSLFGTGMTIVAARRENLLKRYVATPMSTYEYIVSHIAGRVMIFALEFTVIFIAGLALFRFEIAGGLLSYFCFALLGTLAFTALAILCGSRTKNSSLYNGLVNLVTLPMMMLSGVWFSKQNFPDWLIAIADILPLTALVDGLRQIALDGQDFAGLSWQIAVLMIYLLVATVASKVIFKWF